VRVASYTYLLTAEEALDAGAKTYEELFKGLERHDSWGCDHLGRPSELAMRGLISRRLRARFQDQLRVDHSGDDETGSLDAPVAISSEDGGCSTLNDQIGTSQRLTDYEAFSALVTSLVDEPDATKEIVLRRIAGEPAPEIAERVKMDRAAVRKRLSRFRSKHAASLGQAA